jgi:hypothetical protein
MEVILHALTTTTLSVVVVNFILITLNSTKIIYLCNNYGYSAEQ